jgi:hypothetical protein
LKKGWWNLVSRVGKLCKKYEITSGGTWWAIKLFDLATKEW